MVTVEFVGTIVEPEMMPAVWRDDFGLGRWVEVSDTNNIHHMIWESYRPEESVIAPVLEEFYEEGAVYKDDDGRYWYRQPNGGGYPWRGVVSGQNHPEHEPTRPLVKLVPSTDADLWA